MTWHNKFIPTYYFPSIYEIPYEEFKNQGIKALFFDLDNTILPYDIDVLPKDISEYLENLTKDFKVIIVSNSRKKRVSGAVGHLNNISYVKFSRKPLKIGFKKALKMADVKANDAAFIGDQIMTDIFGSNRTKFKISVLVYPVKKRSDHILTRFNRRVEKFIIKRIMKKYPIKYEEVLKPYVEQE